MNAMNRKNNLPKWIGLAVIVVFIVAGILGLMKKSAPRKADLAAVEETLPSNQEDADSFAFDPQPEPSVDGETSPGDQSEPVNQTTPPPKIENSKPFDLGEKTVTKPGMPPIPLPLPNQSLPNPAEGILPELVGNQSDQGTVISPADPLRAASTPPEDGDLAKSEPVPVQKQEPPKLAKPPIPSVPIPAGADLALTKSKPLAEELAPKLATKEPINLTQPTPVAQTPPAKPAPAPATTSPKSVGLPKKEPPIAAVTSSSAPLSLALTPVMSGSAPARNGATHRSAYLISPENLNRYRQENSMVIVPHAADEQAGLATHAEALGFAEWLTRTHRAAGILSASESYRLPLGSENKLAQVWAQDSTPQAANETKPFGIVRVRK